MMTLIKMMMMMMIMMMMMMKLLQNTIEFEITEQYLFLFN